jgi:hypothetical protein
MVVEVGSELLRRCIQSGAIVRGAWISVILNVIISVIVRLVNIFLYNLLLLWSHNLLITGESKQDGDWQFVSVSYHGRGVLGYIRTWVQEQSPLVGLLAFVSGVGIYYAV